MTEQTTELKGVDESLYSRQLYVYGAEAQRRMQETNVLLVGLKGLGVEIAKNIILSGVKSVGILDNEKVQIADLGSQFYLNESHVGKPRAECSMPQLVELNKYVNVHHVEVKSGCQLPYLDESVLKNYNLLVLTGKTLKEQVFVNKLCRKLNIKFISADVHGLLGSVFCDHIEYTVADHDGEREKRGLISAISQDKKGIVRTLDKKRHGLQDGDFVTFTEVKGMTEINGVKPVKIKFKSADSFEVDLDTSAFSKYANDGYYQQVKMPKTFTFEDLETQLKKPDFQFYDGMEAACHCLRYGISAFEESKGRLPDPTVPEEASEIVKSAVEFSKGVTVGKKAYELDEKTAVKLERLAASARAQITPMTATMGGIVGQEIVKACTQKFSPVKQFLYFHSQQSFPEDVKSNSDFAAVGSRYDDYYAVYGKVVQEKIFNMKMFLVGSGAIGCEMLKNWAMMGLSTGQDGNITITDMDTIEKSNLSRQFLFRPKDIGHMKAKCATAAAKVMNPKLKIQTDAIRVGKETENVYNEAFWEGLDGACTALDNVQARLYVDQRCVEFQKPLVDSGTLGTKGNTQVVVPFVTESYGEGVADQPEEGIPVCTLKSFPHKIEHTIQWARDQFEGWFTNGPAEAKNYLEKKGYLEELAQDENSQIGNLKDLNELLVNSKPETFADCVKWARLKFQDLYHNDIIQLLAIYPENKADEKGVPFWSGTKRVPSPLKFDEKDGEGHYDFIVAASNLYAEVFGIKGSTDAKAIRKALADVKVPEFVPDKTVKIAASEEEMEAEAKESKQETQGVMEQIEALTNSLPPPSSLKLTVTPAKFEKDDPTNFHIDFVTACSNLRALNYRIKRESKHQTKFIAGKIIPAIATTTAMVTGMVCLEWYKIAQELKLEHYRNTYANLAIPLFAASEPFFPLKKEIKLLGEKKGETYSYSSWDHLEVKMGNESMKEFLRYWYRVYGFKVSMLSYGATNLYMAASKSLKETRAMLKKPLAETAAKRSMSELPSTDYIKLTVICDNPNADEKASDADKKIDFPPVRFYYK